MPEGETLVDLPRFEKFEEHAVSRALKVVSTSFHDGKAHINLEDLVVDENCAVVFSGGGQDTVLTEMDGDHPSILRGQIIGDAGEHLIFVNPHGFFVNNAPFQNTHHLTLIAALLNAHGGSNRVEDLTQGTGGVVIEGLELLKKFTRKALSLPPKASPLLETPSRDVSRFTAAATFMHIRNSLLDIDQIHLKFLKTALTGSPEDTFHLETRSCIWTDYLYLESLEEGKHLRVNGFLSIGEKGLKIRAHGDVFIQHLICRGPIDIETTGNVFIKSIGLYTYQGERSKIRAKNIDFTGGGDHLGQSGAFTGPFELYARENLISTGLGSTHTHIECGGDWIHEGWRDFNWRKRGLYAHHLVARVYGVLYQRGPINAMQGYEIFAHRYEKTAPLLGTEESHIRVQDVAVLDGFEQGVLDVQGRVILKGQQIKDLDYTPSFLNTGKIQAPKTDQVARIVKNDGHMQTGSYGIVHPNYTLTTNQQKFDAFINTGIFEANDVLWDRSQRFENTGVFRVEKVVFKGGRLVLAHFSGKSLSYFSKENVYYREPSGTFCVSEVMEVLPLYEFKAGHVPNYSSPTFAHDSIRPSILKTYRPFQIVIEGGRAHIARLVLQDYGGQFNRLWDPGALEVLDTESVFLADPKEAPPLASSIEMRGGILEVGDLSLQLDHVHMDPSEDGSLPVFDVKDRAQINIWGEFRNKGTFQYLGSEPLIFNLFPEIAGYISLQGHLNHWGRILAPNAHFSLLGLGKGAGLIKAQDFYYMPYLKRKDRLHGMLMRDPLQGVLYQHLLKEQHRTSRDIEDHRHKIQQEIDAEQKRLIRAHAAQESALRQKEVSQLAALRHQIQQYQTAINSTASTRDSVVGTARKAHVAPIIRNNKRDGGGTRGGGVTYTNVPVYRTAAEKVPYDHQIASYQGQQAQVSQAIASLPGQIQAEITALTNRKAQALSSFQAQRNVQVEEFIRALNGKTDKDILEFKDSLGASTNFHFVVDANTCKFGICAPDVQGIILAKTRVDLGDVVTLKTGQDLARQGMTFVETLARIADQGEIRASTGALVVAESRMPFLQDLAEFFDSVRIKPGDIYAGSIKVGGARATLNARLGLRGLTAEITLSPHMLAMMTFGSIGAETAEITSQALVTTGQINVGILRSFVQTIIDLGGETRIDHLEWGQIAHILRISGSLNLTEPAILAARHLIKFISSSMVQAKRRLHIQAPHVEADGIVKVVPVDDEEGLPEDQVRSSLSIHSESSLTQRSGMLSAEAVSISGAKVATFLGGHIQGEATLAVESGAVLQGPSHSLNAPIVAIKTDHLGLTGHVAAATKVQFSTRTLDLRELAALKTPRVEVFLEENISILMPTLVQQELYAHTKGSINVREPLTLLHPTTLVGERSSTNASHIRGKKGLSIILLGPNSTYYNKGVIHDDQHVALEAPHTVNEKKVVWLSEGRFMEMEGGDITSGNLLEIHGTSYQGDLGLLSATNMWVDVDSLYSSGAIRARGTLVYDAKNSLIERRQHHWQECVTHTTKKKGMFGTKKSSHTTRVNRVESYPIHLSGMVEAGRLIGDPQVDVSEIFPTRQMQGEPLIERMVLQGGKVEAGQGGIRLRVREHFGTIPNIDTILLPYTSSARTWTGKHHQSGFVSHEVATPVSILSQGPIDIESGHNLSFQGAHFESRGIGEQGRIRMIARDGIDFPLTKVSIEHAPQIKRRGMMLYDVRGSHEESIPTRLISPNSWVTIQSWEGDVTGIAPHVTSLDKAPPIYGRAVSFTLPVLNAQEYQVPIGSVVDSNVSTLVSLAASVATWGAGGIVANGLGFVAGGMGSTLVSAGASSLISQAAVGLVVHEGNLLKALKEITSDRGMRSLATAVGSAGLTRGFQARMGIPLEPETFGDFAQVGAFRSGVATFTDVTLGNGEARLALESGLRGFAATTLQGYGAHHIGREYAHDHMGPVVHEGLHGMLGAAAGAILSEDPTRGALAGAMGSMVAESAAGFIHGSSKPFITTQAELEAYGDNLQYQAALARLIGAGTAYTFGQDVTTAAITAGTAVEFNHVASHVAIARDELAAHNTQKSRDLERDAEEEIARISGLAETLEFISKAKEFLFKPPSPPIEDLGEAEIRKSMRAELGRDTQRNLQREWGAYDVPVTGVPTMSSETKVDLRKVYEYAKRHDPQFAWVAQRVEDLPADIESGIQFLKQERERSTAGFDQFVAERSWESFSVRDTLGTMVFGMGDAIGEDVVRVGEALSYVGTGIDYGKAYMRRGLRAMGMVPIVAQGVVNGFEGAVVIKGVADAARGLAAWRESKIFVGETAAPGMSAFPEFASSSRVDKIPVWDVRGSAPKGRELASTEKVHGCSLAYVGDTHVYVMRDSNGMIYKIGESMQGVNKFGQSKRAEAQARKLFRQTGIEHKTEIRRTFETKLQAREYETKLIERYRRMFGDKLLPGNKGMR